MNFEDELELRYQFAQNGKDTIPRESAIKAVIHVIQTKKVFVCRILRRI